MEKRLAKITGAKLEIKERDILNFWIYVEYEEGGGQGIGGIALDTYNQAKGRRVGCAYGCEMIRQLLKTLDVNDFSEMEGQNIWVLGEGHGMVFKPLGIQPLNISGGKTEALIFSDVYEEFRDE